MKKPQNQPDERNKTATLNIARYPPFVKIKNKKIVSKKKTLDFFLNYKKQYAFYGQRR